MNFFTKSLSMITVKMLQCFGNSFLWFLHTKYSFFWFFRHYVNYLCHPRYIAFDLSPDYYIKIRPLHGFVILLGTLMENINSSGSNKMVLIVRKMLWNEESWEKMSTVFHKNTTIPLFFSYILSIKSPFRGYDEVCISSLSADSDYLTEENINEGDLWRHIEL